MAALTLYIKDALASGSSHGSLQDGGTPPSTANTGTGWKQAKTAATAYFLMHYATSASTTSQTSPALPSTGPTTNDCWRTENTYTGTILAGTWNLALSIIATTAGAIGTFDFRVWKGSNATGSGAVEITSGIVTGSGPVTLSISTASNITASFTTGANTQFSNEYIFFQIAWKETTTGSSTTDNGLIRTDSTNSKVTTPSFLIQINGTLSKTLGTLTSNSSGTVLDHAACTKTLGTLTSGSAGTVLDHATSSKTLGTLTSTASGTILDTGLESKTLGSLTSVAISTVLNRSSVSKMLGTLVNISTSTILTHASLIKTLDSVILSSTGSVQNANINGNLSQTLGILNSSAAGIVIDHLSASNILKPLDINSSGTVLETATLSKTLGLLTGTNIASIKIAGSLSKTLGALGDASTGTDLIRGVLTSTLGSLSNSGSSKVLIDINSSNLLGPLNNTAQGIISIKANTSSVLDNISLTSNATINIKTSVTKTLGNLSKNINAEVVLNGDLLNTLRDTVLNSSLLVFNPGDINCALAVSLDTLTANSSLTLGNSEDYPIGLINSLYCNPQGVIIMSDSTSAILRDDAQSKVKLSTTSVYTGALINEKHTTTIVAVRYRKSINKLVIVMDINKNHG